ncbi:hypothetical protein, partial [Endozoicomonas sp.]|uniref:hypothetical protein n=1 Tax=Endozoicomonas sp. TaxID=1892382 RepID=UPI00383B71A5
FFLMVRDPPRSTPCIFRRQRQMCIRDRDKELRLKELAGGDLPTHYTRYWSRPNRYIYYKIFAGELREDLEVLFQSMTQVEVACLLSMPVKTMVYRLKKWGIDRDDQ